MVHEKGGHLYISVAKLLIRRSISGEHFPVKRRLVTGGLRPLHFKAYTTEEAYGLPALYDQHINKKETCGLPPGMEVSRTGLGLEAGLET